MWLRRRERRRRVGRRRGGIARRHGDGQREGIERRLATHGSSCGVGDFGDGRRSGRRAALRRTQLRREGRRRPRRRPIGPAHLARAQRFRRRVQSGRLRQRHVERCGHFGAGRRRHLRYRGRCGRGHHGRLRGSGLRSRGQVELGEGQRRVRSQGVGRLRGRRGILAAYRGGSCELQPREQIGACRARQRLRCDGLRKRARRRGRVAGRVDGPGRQRVAGGRQTFTA